MKVDLSITFSKDEVLAMCLEKCQGIETAVEGRFEARIDYTDSVICEFISKEEDEKKAAMRERYQTAKEAVTAEEPL